MSINAAFMGLLIDSPLLQHLSVGADANSLIPGFDLQEAHRSVFTEHYCQTVAANAAYNVYELRNKSHKGRLGPN